MVYDIFLSKCISIFQDKACDGLNEKASFENSDEIDDVRRQKLREEANLEKEKVCLFF